MKDQKKSFDELISESEPDTERRLKELNISYADIPVIIVFGALFVVVFLQFFTRYILNDSLSWTEEIARYLLIAVAFLGLLKCEALNSHISLEFVDQWAGRHVKKLKIFAHIAMLIFFLFLIYSLASLALQTSFQTMVSLPFPKYWFYAVLLISLAALVGMQFVKLREIVRSNDQ